MTHEELAQKMCDALGKQMRDLIGSAVAEERQRCADLVRRAEPVDEDVCGSDGYVTQRINWGASVEAIAQKIEKEKA